MIRWTTNPLKQLFAMYDLRLLQAASTEVSRKQSFHIPGCYDSQLQAVRLAYMPNEATTQFESHGINRRIINKRVLIIGLLPVIPFCISQYFTAGTLPFQLLGWPLIVTYTSWIYYRKYR